MQKRIVLIGPKGVGKTTVGQMLAEHFKILWVDSDIYIHNVLNIEKKDNYTEEELDHKKELELLTFEHLVQTVDQFVYSSGEGFLLRQSRQCLEAIQKLLEPLTDVILLLPEEEHPEIEKFRAVAKIEIKTAWMPHEEIMNKVLEKIGTP